MGTHAGWSLNLGQWGGAQVRLHATFLLFAACTLYVSHSSEPPATTLMPVPLAFASLAILLAGTLVHELAHYFAAQQLGGRYQEIVLTPFGSLTAPEVPPDPAAEVRVFLAGPLANLLVTVVCGLALVGLGDHEVAGLWQPLFPLRLGTDANTLVAWLRLTFWVNWLLALCNFIPAFPFDGGRVLRAALALVRPQANAAQIVVWLAKFAATLLLLAAWLTRNASWPTPVPAWFGLSLLALFLYFSAQHEEQRLTECLPNGNKSPAENPPAPPSRALQTAARQADGLAAWTEPRHAGPPPAAAEQSQEDERRMDDVLARLYERGMESLSDDDRALLARVSARLRARQRLA